MLLLSLDLSSSQGSVALHRDTTLLRELSLGGDYSHSERVIGSIQELLNKESLTLSGLDRWITTSGPGSFTGLRIAMATLKAFSLVTKKPIDLVSGSEARALAWLKQNPGSRVKDIVVFTKAAAGKFTEEKFSFSTDGQSLELYEDKFPLSARYLAECLLEAKSRRSFTTLDEWISLAPTYFGDTRFGSPS